MLGCGFVSAPSGLIGEWFFSLQKRDAMGVSEGRVSGGLFFFGFRGVVCVPGLVIQ
jgi:hypothetical protein